VASDRARSSLADGAEPALAAAGVEAAAPARLVVGVTAHRDIAPDALGRIASEVRSFLERLRAEHPLLPVAVMSALAEGGDRLVAQVALDLGLELIAPLPLPAHEYARDFSNDASRAEFALLCARARVLELPTASGEGDFAGGGPARDRQYGQLGVFISSHCQVLLALWDGQAAEGVGGTAEVVAFHLHGEMPGLPAGDAPPNLLADDDSDLVFHVHAPRGRDAGARALPPRWLLRASEHPGTEPMPRVYRRLFGQLEGFNADARAHAARIARAGGSLLPASGPIDWPHTARTIDSLYARADWLAMHYRQRVHRSLLLLHVLAVLTGLVFMVYSELHRSVLWVAVLLGIFAVGFAVAQVGARREWHRRYLDYRVLAEGLRVQCYWAIAGVPAAHRVRFAYDSFLQKQDVELGWIRHAMRAASLDGRPTADAGNAGLRWVLTEWVGTREGEGQLAYFRRSAEQRERKYRRTEALGRASLWTSLICAVLLLAGSVLPGIAAQGLLLLMGVAALFAGVREAYSHKLADKELIKQYRFMARIFTGAAQRLRATTDPAQQRRVLEALGQAALEEHAEWILVHRERPLEHNRL
jgi:hypothetical protein